MSTSRPTGLVLPNRSNYIILPDGRLWSEHKQDYKVLQTNSLGYKSANLQMDDGTTKRFSLHRLVAEAYIENPLGLPEVHHIDDNPSNNNKENLMYCTHEQNMAFTKGKVRNKITKIDNPKPNCKNVRCRLSYLHFKKWIGEIPAGRQFTGYWYANVQHDTLGLLAKAHSISKDTATYWFKRGKIRFLFDDEVQPLSEKQLIGYKTDMIKLEQWVVDPIMFKCLVPSYLLQPARINP